MLVGETPFHSDEPVKMYEKILHHDIKFTKNLDKYHLFFLSISRISIKLIKNLTEKNPMNRLMKTGMNIDMILKDKFFSKIDLEELTE